MRPAKLRMPRLQCIHFQVCVYISVSQVTTFPPHSMLAEYLKFRFCQNQPQATCQVTARCSLGDKMLLRFRHSSLSLTPAPSRFSLLRLFCALQYTDKASTRYRLVHHASHFSQKGSLPRQARSCWRWWLGEDHERTDPRPRPARAPLPNSLPLVPLSSSLRAIPSRLAVLPKAQRLSSISLDVLKEKVTKMEKDLGTAPSVTRCLKAAVRDLSEQQRPCLYRNLYHVRWW